MALLALAACGDRIAGDVMGWNTHPNNPGSTPSMRCQVLQQAVNWSCTSTASLPWSTTPMRVTRRPRASHMDSGPALLRARNGDKHPSRGLGEQRHKRVRNHREG